MAEVEQAAALRRSWETNAAAWTCAVREGRIASRAAVTDAAIVDAVRATVPAGGRVLDVGCGEGWLARALGGCGYAVVGVDGSEALVARARALGGADFRVLDYAAIAADPARLTGPYHAAVDPSRLAGPFHAAVVNFALLGDDAETGRLLDALRRVLDPSGTLLIQTLHPPAACGAAPYRDGWRTETFAGLGDFPAPMPWYFRTIGAWLRLVRTAGFALMECQEPVDPVTGRPLSMLLVCRAA